MIGGIQVKYADRQAFNNTGYGYQYEEGGNVSVDYRIMKMMIESNFPYYGMGTTRDRFVAFYYNADYGYDAVIFFPVRSGMTEPMLWEKAGRLVGYPPGTSVLNGISVMNILWSR